MQEICNKKCRKICKKYDKYAKKNDKICGPCQKYAKYALPTLFQPCRSAFARFTPAPPLLVWVLLHLSSSIHYKSSDGPIRVGTVRSESAMHPARSESAGHWHASASDPSQSHPGPDPSMFVSDPSHDPSHSTRSESAVISVPDPVCPSHCGLRSTTSLPHCKGVRGYRAIARRRRRAPGGPPCGVGSTPAVGRA
jgi:hypothetical protein